MTVENEIICILKYVKGNQIKIVVVDINTQTYEKYAKLHYIIRYIAYAFHLFILHWLEAIIDVMEYSRLSISFRYRTMYSIGTYVSTLGLLIKLPLCV